MYKQIWDYIKARYLGEKGQSVIEYTLLIGVVAGAVYFLSSDTSFSTKISDLWKAMQGKIPNTVPAGNATTPTGG